VLDVGTGSGCLAIAIAHERQAARVVATDLSPNALAVGSMNARAHGVERRVHFVCADLTAGLTIRSDLIVANPPYVPEQSARHLSPDVVQYEPAVALFGGADGLRITRRLLHEAPARLAPGGALVMEFGDGQEEGVCDAAERAGWRVDGILHDLQGIARTIILRR
jgi:release factor glutamine methyltransferase